MKKILLICLTIGTVFAGATLTVSSITATDDGFDIQIGYKSDYDVAGYQFTFLNDDALTITGSSDATGTDFQVSAGSVNSVVLGFSLTGTILSASEDFTPLCVLSTTVNNGFDGQEVLLEAVDDPENDLRLIVSNSDAQAGDADFHEAVWTVGSETFALDNELVGPISFSLGNNYPNPFNPSTSIEFSIAEPSFVTLTIFDASGRLVKTLVSESKVADHYSVTWDGTNDSEVSVSAGMYLYKIDAGSFVETKKMLLVK